MSNPAIRSVTRQDFVRRFMASANLTWEEAGHCYEGMCALFEEAVLARRRVNVGNVLSLSPSWHAPRAVNMGFRRSGPEGKIEKVHRTFYLGKRLRYKVNVFKEFLRQHSLELFL